MTLRDWLANRWISAHRTSPREIAALLAVVDRNLADAALEGLSPDGRLGIAYSATLQLATLALAAEGYRPARERAHERAIRSLRYTLGLDAALVRTLDGVRQKRNVMTYESAGTTSTREADEVYRLATELREQVIQWLRTRHPDLLPGA